MAKILIMDDDYGKTEDIRRELARSGHTVEKLSGQNSRSLFESLQQISAATSEIWDLGILDINHASDAFGGMRLWDRITAAGLDTKFANVVICTIYAAELDKDALLRVKAFAKENGIPDENLLDFSSTNFRPFISRIEQLLTK